MRLSRRHLICYVATAAAIAIVYIAYRLTLGRPFTFNELANRQMLEMMIDDPEYFTQVGLIDGTLLDYHSGRLTPVGIEKRDKDFRDLQRHLREIESFDRSRLSTQEQITYDMLHEKYASALSFERFTWMSSEGLYPITPVWGTEETLVSFLVSQHVIRNMRTARNYVRRLELAGAKLDSVTAEMNRQAILGVVLPAALLDRSLGIIQDTTRLPANANPLYTSFVDRLAGVPSISNEQGNELKAQALAAIRSQIYPAFSRMRDSLLALRPRALGQSDGVGRLPDGSAYYTAALRQMTTTEYTAEQIHELGLAEVERITKSMDSLLRRQHITQGTVGARMAALREDPQQLFADTSEGREAAIKRYQQILDDIAPRISQYFIDPPRDRLMVRRVPATAEAGDSGAYYEPAALDGSRPATFFANLHDVRDIPKWGMKTDSYHEGLPGHHLQISIAQRLRDLPLARRQLGFAAYDEGWALYAEQLAAEMGMYADDPLGDLGRLRGELFRAARLVVDTGLHSKGWSRERAIQYMRETTGMAAHEVEVEIERYMGMPGQACAYKIGELKILELRQRARAVLGERFNLKEFHKVVLENGSVPLTVLEQQVNRWLAEQAEGRVGSETVPRLTSYALW